jgi:hypothetical protein
MLRKLLVIACVLVFALGVFLVPFPDGVVTMIVVTALASLTVIILRRVTPEKEFITNVFLLALVVRLGFGIFIHVMELREFFGGDALTYDWNGAGWMNVWLGQAQPTAELLAQNDPGRGAGWGMNYFTAAIYMLVGQNIFAAQSVCAMFGAATAPLVYFCANKVFNNMRVAKVSAIVVAVFPSMVIWSSQLLKDGLIIFLLVLAMTMVLQLQTKFGYAALGLLLFALLGVFSLRFYIFYMVLVAVVGSLVVGMSNAHRHILRSTIVLVLLGVGLTYVGVGQRAAVELRVFGSLERVQMSRSDLARRAESGYGEDQDVSTTEGALSVLPVGFTFLMLAPFPWQAANFRQAITTPEMLVWWAMLPLFVLGLIYTVKNRLRNAFPILIFSLLLTVAYSIFQGNVGTAYRQRTQIQVFMFIFIAVGWTLFLEKRENKRILNAAAYKRLQDNIRRRDKPQDEN